MSSLFIYFLIKKEKVIYVGKTNNLTRRLNEHKAKEYDYYFYIKCAKDYAAIQEDRYIILFDPPLNKSLNSRGEYKSLEVFCKENKFELNEVRKIWRDTPYIQPVFNENFHPYILNSLKALCEGAGLGDE